MGRRSDMDRAVGLTLVCCTTSAHAAAAVAVSVTYPDSGFGEALSTAPFTFAYTAAPKMFYVDPPVGHAGSTLTINGTGLSLSDATPPTVTIGAAACALTSWDATSVTCTAKRAWETVTKISISLPPRARVMFTSDAVTARQSPEPDPVHFVRACAIGPRHFARSASREPGS